MLAGPVRRCKSPPPIAHAEGVSRQHGPLFADCLHLSHGLAIRADRASSTTRRTHTSTTLCIRDTRSWALAEGVMAIIHRLSQLFGQVARFACSLRQISRGWSHLAAGARHAGYCGRGRCFAEKPIRVARRLPGRTRGRILAPLGCHNGERARRLHARRPSAVRCAIGRSELPPRTAQLTSLMRPVESGSGRSNGDAGPREPSG